MASMLTWGKALVKLREVSPLLNELLILDLQEQKAEALQGGALRTFKQQISFGLHVLVMMGTFYVFGHVAGAAISDKVSVVRFRTSLLVTVLHACQC